MGCVLPKTKGNGEEVNAIALPEHSKLKMEYLICWGYIKAR